MTKTIVVGPFLFIGKHGVGFLNFFEPFLSVGFRASVGMVFPSKATKSVLQIPAAGRLFDAQDFVVVSFVAHVVVLVVCDAGPDLNLTPRFHRLRPQCGQ